MAERMNVDAVLWNWTRWCWAGAPVGNMAWYVPETEDYHPIEVDHALAVERMHQALPLAERMIIIAEYPQRHGRFAGLEAHQRRTAALRWIAQVTGNAISATEYRLYLGLFKDKVTREVC